MKIRAITVFADVGPPIDEEQMWDEQGKRHEDAFEILHDAIRWSLAHDLKVVVDLHILRSHHFNAEDKPLWTDPAEQERFIDLWRDLSDGLHSYPLDRVVYELMNEPVADDPDDWNRLVPGRIASLLADEDKLRDKRLLTYRQAYPSQRVDLHRACSDCGVRRTDVFFAVQHPLNEGHGVLHR